MYLKDALWPVYFSLQWPDVNLHPNCRRENEILAGYRPLRRQRDKAVICAKGGDNEESETPFVYN